MYHKMRVATILILLAVALVIFSVRAWKLYRYMMRGKREERLKDRKVWERVGTVLINVFGQKKLFRELNPGIQHFLIFWGFVILSLATIETVISGIFRSFSLEFLGHYPYTAYSIMKEFFGVLVAAACLYGLARRFIIRPKRFDYSLESQFDATFILMMILTLMVTMFIAEAANLAMELSGRESIERLVFGSDYISNPVSFFIARDVLLDKGMSYMGLRWTFLSAWWVHYIVLLSFGVYIPFSKHLHLLSAIPNVFLSSLTPKGELRNLNLEDEKAESFGVGKIEDFTWKQLLDLYACTECGRCHINCPAQYTGKELSPRKLILDLKEHLIEKGPRLVSGKGEFEKSLIGVSVKEKELWACTTCRACQEECPVFIEHPDKIIDMRRHLVLMESKFPEEVQITFKNLETNYNPWSFGYSARADWAQGLDIPLASEKKNFDYLFWVGCAGSFDERGKKITQAFVKILKTAGVDFAILGTEEKCTGDSARRIGNEYLAQILIKENVETLKKYKFKKILTFCPHCFNAIKNDFPQFGAKYEIMHHSEFIAELIKQGKIKVNGDSLKLTYHDSCYLGRYNGIYDEPREVLRAGKGVDLIEMARRRDKAFCCGAGGGRIWMEEKEGTRISEDRVKEALSLSPDAIATACPFCLTMMEDGLKAVDKDGKVKAFDIAEVVAKMI